MRETRLEILSAETSWETSTSSFALERADSELSLGAWRTGLLTRDVLPGRLRLPTLFRGSGICNRECVAYSCGAVADFHRASRTSRQRKCFSTDCGNYFALLRLLSRVRR